MGRMRTTWIRKAAALITGGVIAFAMAAVLGGCTSEEDALPEENVKYEIALVTDDSLVMDGGHSETAWNAITEFGGTHGISHKYYKATEQTDAAFEDAIKTAINKGAKVVIVDNNKMAKAVFEMQETYPEIDFVIMDQNPYDPDNGNILIAKNTASIAFDSGQAGYLAGYAAVIDGSTQLGFIGENKSDEVKDFGYGYVMGAERASGEVGEEATMVYKYCEDPSDRDAIYKTANEMYENGVQVIFAAGNEIQEPVIEAAEAQDGKVIGSFTDQSKKSDKVITSAEYGIADALKGILGQYVDEKFPGGEVVQFDARNEGIGLELKNNKLSNLTQKQYDDIYEALAKGEIKVNTENIKSVKDIITVNLTVK